MSKISALIKQALKEDSSIEADVSFSSIYNFHAQKINELTGVDCKGSEIVITAYDIAHIMKGHGNDKEERERGQIGVVASDFDQIKNIIENYDYVEKGRELRNTKSLVFKKRIGVEYTIIVTVTGKIPNKKMVIKTMYKKP